MGTIRLPSPWLGSGPREPAVQKRISLTSIRAAGLHNIPINSHGKRESVASLLRLYTEPFQRIREMLINPHILNMAHPPHLSDRRLRRLLLCIRMVISNLHICPIISNLHHKHISSEAILNNNNPGLKRQKTFSRLLSKQLCRRSPRILLHRLFRPILKKTLCLRPSRGP